MQGFPTIKFMWTEGGKVKQQDYQGARTAKEIVAFAMDKAKALALKRIGEKAPKATAGGSSGGDKPAGDQFYPPGGAVQALDEAGFDAVLKSKDTWLVEFYAPWCGHCKALKEPWAAAAECASSPDLCTARVTLPRAELALKPTLPTAHHSPSNPFSRLQTASRQGELCCGGLRR